MKAAAPPTMAVIGAGVAACSLVAALRRGGWPGELVLLESGRGAGGRTATRRSRQDPGLRLDHGAPLFNIAHQPLPALLAPLLAAGAIQPYGGVVACLEGDGQLRAGAASPVDGDPLLQGELFTGCGGMDQLCAGLLALAQATPAGTAHPLQQRFGVLVRRLQPEAGGGWRLLDPQGLELARSDWLLLSSTLPAHPRTRLLLDWPEEPLREAGRALADPRLDHALASIASIRSQARSNLLLVSSGAAAAAWRALPFRLLRFDGLAEQLWGLSRLSIQDLEDGRMAVVAQSTAVFAAEHLSVYGSGSAMARLMGRPPREQEEAAVVAALREALLQAMAALLPAAAVRDAEARLMRWGAALPERPGLPPELVLCPASRLGFCGDYVDLPGFGRVEGALRSGELLAARLLEHLGQPGASLTPAG